MNESTPDRGGQGPNKERGGVRGTGRGGRGYRGGRRYSRAGARSTMTVNFKRESKR